MAAFEDLRQLMEAGQPQPVMDFLRQHPLDPHLVFRMLFWVGADDIWDPYSETRQGSSQLLRQLMALYPDYDDWSTFSCQWTPALLGVILEARPKLLFQCLFDAHCSSSLEVKAYLLSRLERSLIGELYTPWKVLFFVAELLGRKKRARFGLPDELPLLVIDRLGLVEEPAPVFVNYAQHRADLEPQMKEDDLRWYIEYLQGQGRADMAAMLEGWRARSP